MTFVPLTSIVGAMLLILMVHITEGRDLHRNGANSDSQETSSQLVLVQETQVIHAKTSNVALPAFLRFRFDVHGKTVTLNLRKNSHLSGNIPIYFEGPDGPTLADTKKMKHVAFYQDIQGGAAITVTTDPGVSKATKNLEGIFLLNGVWMNIAPETKSVRSIAEFLLKRALGKDVDGELHRVSRATPVAKNGNTGLVDDFKASKAFLAKSNMNNTIIVDDVPIQSRRRRQTSGGIDKYDVEVMFVLDDTIWKYWVDRTGGEDAGLQQLQYYFFHQFNAMDLAYQRIDVNQWGLQINLWLKQFHIAKTAADNLWVLPASIRQSGSTPKTTYVDENKILEELGKWVKTDGRSWSNPDHAMLWTRYNIADDPTVGVSRVGGICRGSIGVSIVEDTGLHSWAVGAHELGHNLGSDHDDGSQGCSAKEKFLMTAISGAFDTDNTFMFSPCSIATFKATLAGTVDGYPRVCLYNDVCQDGMDVATLDELMSTTDLYSPNEQCRLMKGEQYSTCYDAGEEICQTLYCSTGGGPCYGYTPGGVDGTTCGNGKVCLMGRCQGKTTTATSGSSSCTTQTSLSLPVPSGCDDNAFFVMNLQLEDGSSVPYKCQGITRDYPEWCFTQPSVTAYCCRSCHLAGLSVTTQ